MKVRFFNVLGTAILLLAGCSNPDGEKSSYAIQDMRAFPYYPETGLVRRDLNLFDKNYLLWNVIVGGDCGSECLPEIPGKTTITIIEVQVIASNEPNFSTSVDVELRAQEKGENRRSRKAERVRLAGVQTAGARTWLVPFALYGTGCQELEISARLIHGNQPLGEALNKRILFKCGE